MLVPFFRTLVLYLCIILAVRLMGKRQVGEMQPAEPVSYTHLTLPTKA